MTEDREILREVWEGKLPVCFQLSQEEIYTVEQPDPFFLLVPRLSYFPLVTDKVYRHMVKHVEPDEHCDMWLECNGQPLKWHYPIGVLFDLHGDSNSLPWNVTVHFQNFPEDDLLHCPSKDAVESHYVSVVKEADALKHRGQIINSMQKKDHKALWSGFMKDKFDQFWSVNKKLMENTGEDKFKHIPFKIHQVDKVPIQKLIKQTDEGGNFVTLRHLLRSTVPDIFGPDETLSKRILTQGVQPSLETPLAWMSEHLSYPDNFLHICLLDPVVVES